MLRDTLLLFFHENNSVSVWNEQWKWAMLIKTLGIKIKNCIFAFVVEMILWKLQLQKQKIENFIKNKLVI